MFPVVRFFHDNVARVIHPVCLVHTMGNEEGAPVEYVYGDIPFERPMPTLLCRTQILLMAA